MTAPSTPVAYAGPEHTGAACPICHEPISAHQLIQICEVCAMPVHRRCWESGQGCSRLECPVGSVAASVERKSTLSGQPPLSTPPAQASAPAAGIGGFLTLLIVGTIIPVLGPMLGIIFGFLWLDGSNPPSKRRDGRILLIYSCVTFILSLIAVALNLATFINALQGGEVSLLSQLR